MYGLWMNMCVQDTRDAGMKKPRSSTSYPPRTTHSSTHMI